MYNRYNNVHYYINDNVFISTTINKNENFNFECNYVLIRVHHILYFWERFSVIVILFIKSWPR